MDVKPAGCHNCYRLFAVDETIFKCSFRSDARRGLLVPGGAGGKRLVEEGALEGVAAVHGLHVWPSLPAGIYGTRVRVAIAMHLLACSDLHDFSHQHVAPWLPIGPKLQALSGQCK